MILTILQYLLIAKFIFCIFFYLWADCHGKPADVYFLLDSSTSIQPEEFKKQTSFVKDIMYMLEIGQSNTRVGVATFSDKYDATIRLGQLNNKTALMGDMDRVPYLGGNTNTGAALRRVTDEFRRMSRREVIYICKILLRRFTKYDIGRLCLIEHFFFFKFSFLLYNSDKQLLDKSM